jgi:hypothetical protein
MSSVKAVLPTKGSPTTTKRMLPSRAADSSGTTLLPKRAIQAVRGRPSTQGVLKLFQLGQNIKAALKSTACASSTAAGQVYGTERCGLQQHAVCTASSNIISPMQQYQRREHVGRCSAVLSFALFNVVGMSVMKGAGSCWKCQLSDEQQNKSSY